jgi:hypothetical protein
MKHPRTGLRGDAVSTPPTPPLEPGDIHCHVMLPPIYFRPRPPEAEILSSALL